MVQRHLLVKLNLSASPENTTAVSFESSTELHLKCTLSTIPNWSEWKMDSKGYNDNCTDMKSLNIYNAKLKTENKDQQQVHAKKRAKH